MMRTWCLCLLLVTLLELTLAQRPSFAGARPPGGLSQKDKYLGTQNTAVENLSGVDIVTRFGNDAVPQRPAIVNLPYGASQKPPMGVPLVYPVGSAAAAPVDLANRFGSDDSGASSSGAGLRPAVNASSSPSFGFSPSSSASPSFSGSPSFSVNASSSSGSSSSASSGPNPSAASPTSRPLANALPIDAHGDQNYVDYLNGLPEENRPFWFLNYQAIEALRNNSRPNVGAFETRGPSFAG
ncbi:hypothetical protein KR222_009823 [Zaprionus bogoriensis]|nr:hypothetical protein KR222_009823 [Zaprionus bogoriensis]